MKGKKAPRVIAWATNIAPVSSHASERPLTKHQKMKVAALLKLAGKHGATHAVRTTNGGVTVDYVFASYPMTEKKAWLWRMFLRRDEWPSQKMWKSDLYWNPKVMRVEKKLVVVS